MKGFKHGMDKSQRKEHKRKRKERQNARGKQWQLGE